ncbi:MAG: hypothetical protein A1D16_12570 [Flavihumibacter sp. CACIAM 22H1]|nr:MAG: hypothetical protein A1D16_12570 [Flavihumibacter sp. CACIAM 22H1]
MLSLKAQVYNNWQAIVVGEQEELEDERFILLEHDLVEKKKKLCFALEYIRTLQVQPDFLIRLDDDDLFSSIALEQLKEVKADCIADGYHGFVEILTGKISRQKRNWLANTVAHKTTHAYQLTENGNLESYLLVPYYQNRTIFWTSKQQPLYLRVLAPGSITSKAANKTDKPAADYLNYLLGFGSWSGTSSELKGFEQSFLALRAGVSLLTDTGMEEFNFPLIPLIKNRLYELMEKFSTGK